MASAGRAALDNRDGQDVMWCGVRNVCNAYNTSDELWDDWPSWTRVVQLVLCGLAGTSIVTGKDGAFADGRMMWCACDVSIGARYSPQRLWTSFWALGHSLQTWGTMAVVEHGTVARDRLTHSTITNAQEEAEKEWQNLESKTVPVLARIHQGTR